MRYYWYLNILIPIFVFPRERLRRVLRKKAAVILHLHAFTSADLHLHTFTSADLLHTLTPADLDLHTFTSSHPHICRSTSSHPHMCWSTSSHPHICRSIVVLLDAQWYCALPPAPRHPLLFFNRLPLLPTVLSFIFFIGIVSLGSSSLS